MTECFSFVAQAADTNALSLLDMLLAGGWTMWLLAVCSLVMCYLATDGYRMSAPRRFLPADLLELDSVFQSGDRAQILETLADSPSLLCRTMESVIEKHATAFATYDRDALETAITAQYTREEAVVLRGISHLNLIATIAPMLGLLGTVSGMIGAFQTMAFGAAGDPELLAGDIGEALVTTASGLAIGIPAMLLSHALRSRLESHLGATYDATNDLLDTWQRGTTQIA